MDTLSGCERQIFDHMQAERMRVGLCTWYKNGRTCVRVFITQLPEEHFGKFNVARVNHMGVKYLYLEKCKLSPGLGII